jgi:F0F1-type ATP synthase assembly protein I
MVWTEDQERAARARQQLWRIGSLGMELFASIIGMFLLGWLLDVWTGSSYFKLIGLGIGLIGGTWNFYKTVRGIQRAQSTIDAGMNPRKATPRQRDHLKAPPTGIANTTAASGSTPRSVPSAGPERHARDPGLFSRSTFSDEELEQAASEVGLSWPEDDTPQPGSPDIGSADPDDEDGSDPTTQR